MPGCGAVTEGQSPEGVTSLVQYGPRVYAWAALAVCAHYLPVARGARLMAAYTGVNVSAGFMAGVRGKAASRLDPFMDQVRKLLRAARSMADLLIWANKRATAARAAGQARLDDGQLTQIRSWYRGAVAKGITDNQGKRSKTGTDGLRLARRFRHHQDMILRFAADLTVGFTSNGRARSPARQSPAAHLRRLLAHPAGPRRPFP